MIFFVHSIIYIVLSTLSTFSELGNWLLDTNFSVLSLRKKIPCHFYKSLFIQLAAQVDVPTH